MKTLNFPIRVGSTTQPIWAGTALCRDGRTLPVEAQTLDDLERAAYALDDQAGLTDVRRVWQAVKQAG